MTRPFVWGHRGASAVAPENTLAAFFVAQEDGADGLELDIHLSRDGVPVVIHDETVDRTTDGRGAVETFALRELQALDAGGWFAEDFAGETVPMLETVLDLFSGRLRLNLEVKDVRAGQVVIEMLQGYPRADVLLSSFNWRLLKTLRESTPSLPMAVLLETADWHRALAVAEIIRAEALHPRLDRVSRGLVQQCREKQPDVSVWTVDDLLVLRRFQRIGVSRIFSNNPGISLASR